MLTMYNAFSPCLRLFSFPRAQQPTILVYHSNRFYSDQHVLFNHIARSTYYALRCLAAQSTWSSANEAMKK